MKLEKNKYYKVEIVRHGRHLEYTFLVKDIIKDEYLVLTSDGEKLRFKENEVLRKKETTPFSFSKEVYEFRKKGVKENLKPLVEPKFS